MHHDCIELDEGAAGLRPAARFARPMAWRGADVDASHWVVELPPAAVAELEAVVARLRREQLPVHLLSAAMFDLETCSRVMNRVRERLDRRLGVALLDRLPIERWSLEETRAIYWVLAQLLSQPVAQQADGLMFRDIVDAGGGEAEGNERAVTNRVLTFHTDNSGNRTRPDYVSLLCLGAPLAGGESRYCTVYSIYNAMADEDPDLLERLFEPYLHDRQGIQAPGEPDVLRAPALSFDGERLRGRYSLNKIGVGYRKAGVTMDARGRAALDAVVRLIERERLACSFSIGPGQVQYLNNLEGLHHRADYTDGALAHQRRHMLRMWLRHQGTPFFDG